MKRVLKVGDTVMWRGAWGAEPAKPAKVLELEITEFPHEKHGMSVEKVSWKDVVGDCVLLVLDNGHWCYGKQVSPVE